MNISANLDRNLWSSMIPNLNLLKNSRTAVDVNQIHSRLITTGLIRNPNFTTKIVLAFVSSKNQHLVEFARRIFFDCHADFHFFRKVNDPFLWNAVIKSYSHGPDPRQALLVFCLMLEKGICPDKFSFSLVLKACSRIGLVREGMQIHGILRKTEIQLDLYMQNCLIGVYIKCGCLGFACQLFDRMPSKDSVSYNSMIDGYVKHGLVDSARELFDSMPMHEKNLISWNSMICGFAQSEEGFKSARNLFDEMPEQDLISWNSMLDGCVKHGKMEDAQAFFDAMPKRDKVSWANMIDGYGKLGKIYVAKSLYDEMPEKDVVACNTMMANYVQNGYFMEALEIFHNMEKESELRPDQTTLLIVLSAIAQLGKITNGIAMHLYIAQNGYDLDGKLGVGLIDMYSKCGSIKNAMRVFEEINHKTIDHWNAMIGGLAIHGFGDLAFNLLLEMERFGIEPDDITFIGVLNACGHNGLVKEGLICFELMRRKHQIEPKLQHYGCLVDILARSGNIGLAKSLIQEMTMEPNDVIWRTLLSACNNHNHNHNRFDGTEEFVAKRLIGMDDRDSSSYVILSNMYAGLGMWEDVRRVRKLMKRRNVKKLPGCSWIELEGAIHEFFVQDMSHLHNSEISTCR